MTSYDHVLILAITVGLPLLAAYNYPRFRARVEAGVPHARERQYRSTIVRQWALLALVAAAHGYQGRSFESLGLEIPSGPRFVLAAALAVGLAWLWRTQVRAALDDETGRELLVGRLGELRAIVPETERELRWFYALSLTAGVCEEILFRGYLIAYLAGSVGFGPAAVLSGVIFGLGHLYQGPRKAFQIVFAGWVFVLFYVLSGTIWISMALHAALDAAQGRLGYRLLGDPVKNVNDT